MVVTEYMLEIKNGSITFSEKASKQDLFDFKDRIDSIKQECIDFLLKEKAAGKSIHVYGASTKEM